MIAWLALSAHAEPPRAEVLAGWYGAIDRGYGFVSVAPALLRSADASLVLRGTVSQMRYIYFSGDERHEVDAPGTAVGPGFTYTPGDLGLGMSVEFGVRHATSRFGAQVDRRLVPDAILSGNVYWRPQQRANLYGSFSFAAHAISLWARAGATHPLIPLLDPDPAVALWMGFEATSFGNFDSRLLELGPVAELPIRDLDLVLSVRAGLSVEDDAADSLRRAGSYGLGLYWAY